jgi:Cysteine-rich CPCC
MTLTISKRGIRFTPAALSHAVEASRQFRAVGAQLIIIHQPREGRYGYGGDPTPSTNGMVDVLNGTEFVWYVEEQDWPGLLSGVLDVSKDGIWLVRSAKERYPCPCCGYLTLNTADRGSYDICPVCFWEDDAVQFEDPDYAGGANVLSLTQARKNFLAIHASDPRFAAYVRPPESDEAP